MFECVPCVDVENGNISIISNVFPDFVEALLECVPCVDVDHVGKNGSIFPFVYVDDLPEVDVWKHFDKENIDKRKNNLKSVMIFTHEKVRHN